jgi:hypothetical protein
MKTITYRQRKFARLALGLPNEYNMSYRNHFSIGIEGDAYSDWEDLVSKGLAVKRSFGLHGGFIFHLTLEGALMVREPQEHISPQEAETMRRLTA